MLNWLTNIYRQITVILESNSATPKDYQADQQDPRVTQSTSEFTSAINMLEPQTLRAVSSTVVIGRSELSQQYLELGEALHKMVELDENDEWRIDEPVYVTASRIAAELMAVAPYPAPHIFNHGPKSVVFNWLRETTNLYLTISSNRISALLSSPERIEQRIDQSINQLMNPTLFLSSLQPSHWGHGFALIKAVSDDPTDPFD
jgi:hypothetical protein